MCGRLKRGNKWENKGQFISKFFAPNIGTAESFKVPSALRLQIGGMAD
jgi:hypothetical protein